MLDGRGDVHDAMIALLRTLVNTDSGSYDKAGVDAAGGHIRDFLGEHGIRTEVTPGRPLCSSSFVPCRPWKNSVSAVWFFNGSTLGSPYDMCVVRVPPYFGSFFPSRRSVTHGTSAGFSGRLPPPPPALEAAEFGVRINAVAPSLAMHAFLSKVTTDDLLAELTTREAFGRAAEPWEVANVIVFLASDYSTYMTGEVVSVSSQHP